MTSDGEQSPPTASTVASPEPSVPGSVDETPHSAPFPSSCLVTADRDGDGASRTADECAGESVSSGFPRHGQEDCDDTDPTRRHGVQYYTDGDGDGYGIPRVESAWGCRGDMIDGFAPNTDDCDDANHTLHQWKYVDADSDGGGSGEPVCVGDADAGFSPRADDCDDANAAIHHRAEGERTLDGVDTDCDGYDYPTLSGADDPVLAIPDGSRCEGAALSIIAVELNWNCGGGFMVQVGNRGSVPVEFGTLRIERATGRVDDVELPVLAPGEVVRAGGGGGGEHIITLATGADPGDCMPMSETGRVLAPFVDCL